MIRVVIMCHGQQTRLADLKIRKHLLPLPLCGTTILQRTIGMLEGARDVGEIVVVGPPDIAAALGFTGMMDSIDLATWSSSPPDHPPVNGYEDPGVVYMATPPCLEVVTLGNKPGHSVIRGLQKIRAYLAQDRCGPEIVYDRTVVLMGDVVYSRRCLSALLHAVPPAEQPIWFAVTPDLSPSTGEVFGLSYSRAGTAEFLDILDNVAHPPFDAYQPGQLRRLLWDRQSREGERWLAIEKVSSSVVAGAVRSSLRSKPHEACCTILDHDFTRDIDTVKDLMRLGELDVAAWHDDRGLDGAAAIAIGRFEAPADIVNACPPCAPARCQCTNEAGDSACSVHPTDSDTGEPIGNWRNAP